jgi:hypothetical protein
VVTVQPPIQDPIGAMIGPMVTNPTPPSDTTGSIAPGVR